MSAAFIPGSLAREMGMASKAQAWGEAHRREALRRTYEIAAEMVGAGNPAHAVTLGAMCTEAADRISEVVWRAALLFIKLDPARIDREVRRVRALAEGQLVRETVWRWRDRMGGHEYEHSDRRAARSAAEGAPIVRVTRIRRAK